MATIMDASGLGMAVEPRNHIGSAMDVVQGESDDVLEDMGFFDTSHPINAQQALNELGLNPSPPKGREQHPDFLGLDEQVTQVKNIHSTSESEYDFDLDKELEYEQEILAHRSEDEHIADESDRGHDDGVLESNGILDGSESNSILEEESLPDLDSFPHHTRIPKSLEQNVPMNLSPRPAIVNHTAGPSRSSDAPWRNETPVEEDDDDDADNMGLNGLPKYIPSGATSAILLDGTTVRFERRKRLKGWKPKPVHYGSGATNLLSQPVHQIIDRIEARMAEKVVDDEDNRQDNRQARQPKTLKTTEMWQERYRPVRFTELVGEERVHREVMGWLKEWDTCVFGKRRDKKRMREELPSMNNMVQDKWNRPAERLLLLGGPAGMGKTTLAHIAAKTCGYLVHELNASDDRSARTVEDRVRDALETKNIRSERPTCVILDEIDGATGGGDSSSGGGFIRALITMLDRGASTASKKKKRHRPLLRPIICICNDPYAAPLRALRPYAKLVRLNRPSTPALIGRLRQICEREDIKADTAGLNLLISMCQGDMRSCLNAMQLVQADPRGLTAATLQGNSGRLEEAAILSSKDASASIHQVWTRLFRTQTAKERDRGRNRRCTTSVSEGTNEAQWTVDAIMNSGEMDKVLAGCFEHYPNLKLVDDGWWRFHKAHEWIHWYEHLNQRGWELGNQVDMWAYLPWSFACWPQLFANTANELPEYPRVDYQNHVKKTAYDEVVLDVFRGLSLHTQVQFDKLSMVTELGPLLAPILTPSLSPINSQLVRPEEKVVLASAVAVMHHTNVDFVLDKNEQGHMFYRFDPPLEVFSHYEGKRVNPVAGSAAKFHVRQLLNSELKALRLRQKQDANGGSHGATEQRRGRPRPDEEPQPKQAPKPKCAVDFFGRPVVSKASQAVPSEPVSMSTMPPAKRTKLKVFYHYHEGYSNAVRKPIKMSTLLS